MDRNAGGSTTELRGLAAQRSRFHLGYRLLLRTYGAWEAAKRSDPRMVAIGSAASLAADTVVWWAMRHSSRLHFVPRLVTDTIDTAAWSRNVTAPPEVATFPGITLAIEAGVR